jgi:hypothetical protein
LVQVEHRLLDKVFEAVIRRAQAVQAVVALVLLVKI